MVLSPWLAGPWLAGAWTARRDGSLAWGAAAGLILLMATVVTYLVMAGADAVALLPRLPLLAVAAGLGFGAAGAELHNGERGRIVAAVAVSATLVIEGLLLQLGAQGWVERGLFVAEALAGALLAVWIGGFRAGVLVTVAGVVVVGIALAVVAIIAPGVG